jgi:hypothetical protein
MRARPPHSKLACALEDSLDPMRPSEREPFEQLSETINCIRF